MKDEFITWTDIIRVPDPETTLTILLHVIVHFWRAEYDKEYYQTNVFPQDISQVVLRIDHQLYKQTRYHIYEVGDNDLTGVWDETPYHVGFRGQDKPLCHLDHGDYRHDFQLFLRSFLRNIKDHSRYYPPLHRLVKILENFSLLQWKCSVCRSYNDWSRKVVETILLENVSIAPSSLLFLMTFKNKKMAETFQTDCSTLDELLMVAIRRFFLHFEKIHEQTNMDPIIILENLITILDKYTSVYSADQIHEFEQGCIRDMKTYLYKEFKYLRTRSIGIHYFPRDMMIIRDLFPMLVSAWSSASIPNQGSSPGLLMLFYNMLFEDRAIEKTNLDGMVVVQHALDKSLPMMRHPTPKEKTEFTSYHPLLRPCLFQS